MIGKIKEVYRDRAPRLVGEEKRFAVLMPLIEVDEEIYLVYEVRAADMKTQPGEICFPGGKIEPGESIKNAALREMHEELGIQPSKIQVIGQGDYLRNHANITIYTYLGVMDIDDYNKRVLNPYEVAETFLLPLSWLRENKPLVYMTDVSPKVDENFPYDRLGVSSDYPWRKGRYTIPLYEYPDGGVIRPIWGMTALLTMHFMENINGEGGYDWKL